MPILVGISGCCYVYWLPTTCQGGATLRAQAQGGRGRSQQRTEGWELSLRSGSLWSSMMTMLCHIVVSAFVMCLRTTVCVMRSRQDLP